MIVFARGPGHTNATHETKTNSDSNSTASVLDGGEQEMNVRKARPARLRIVSNRERWVLVSRDFSDSCGFSLRDVRENVVLDLSEMYVFPLEIFVGSGTHRSSRR